MKCPRCQKPTHVVETRASGSNTRRRRRCGQVEGGKLVGGSCGLVFPTLEIPSGLKSIVQISIGLHDVEAKIVKKLRKESR